MNTLLYNTKEAKNQLNQIINYVMTSQETVWITKDKKPVVKISPIEKKPRQLGLLKDDPNFWIADDFDEADEVIESLFSGERE